MEEKEEEGCKKMKIRRKKEINGRDKEMKETRPNRERRQMRRKGKRG